jgi:HSP20 family protein
MNEVRIHIGDMVHKIQEDVKRLVKGFSEGDLAAYAMGQWVPQADILEGRSDVRILVDLAGVPSGNVEVSLTGDQVKVRGEKPSGGAAEGVTVHLAERRTGSFSRTFSLPASADREKLTAVMRDGLLEISCPKKPESMEREVKIQIQ